MPAEVLRLGVEKIIHDVAEVDEGTSYGLPTRANLVEWQVVAEGTVTVLIECSLDGVNWYTVATVAAAAAGGGTFLSGAKYIRSNVTVNAGSDGVVTTINVHAYGVQVPVPMRVPYMLAQTGAPVTVTADSTDEEVLATLNIPGGLMKRNGMLRLVIMWQFTGSTNNKSLRIRMTDIAGTVLFLTTQAVLANLEYTVDFVIQNTDSESAQVCRGAAQWGAAAVTPVTTAINTANQWSVVITGQKATGSETITLLHWNAQIFPAD